MRLVLLPGQDGSGKLFHSLVSNLPSFLEPVVVSYPATSSSYSELFPLVRARLPAAGRFVILGESFSGPLALLAAAERPPGLVGLVLVASFVRSPFPRPLRFFWSILGGPILRWTPWSWVARVLLGRDHASGPVSAELREAVSAIPPSVLAARVRAVLRVDVTRELEELRVPLLYVAASRDTLVSRASVGFVQRHSENAQVVEIDAPHLVLQTAPAEAAAAIAGFIRRAVAF